LEEDVDAGLRPVGARAETVEGAAVGEDGAVGEDAVLDPGVGEGELWGRDVSDDITSCGSKSTHLPVVTNPSSLEDKIRRCLGHCNGEDLLGKLTQLIICACS
jgi:hypothetical protein